MRKFIPAFAIVFLWLGWFTWLVFYGGLKWPHNNETAGQLGDAFGAVASFMATLAAVGVYFTYVQAQEARNEQGFEDNFFRLLSNFEQISANVTLSYGPFDEAVANNDFKYLKLWEESGRTQLFERKDQRAIRVLLYLIRNEISPNDFGDSKAIHRAYMKVHQRYVDNVGHYFRILYHIYCLIHTAPVKDKMKYARMVRAHLSESELRLLAYNLSVGEGRHKFKKLANDYAILHNMSRFQLDPHEEAEVKFFLNKVGKNAFKFDRDIPFSYD